MEQEKVKEMCKEIVRLLDEQTRVMKAGRSGSFGDMTVLSQATASHLLEWSPVFLCSRAFRVESCPSGVRGIDTDIERQCAAMWSLGCRQFADLPAAT